MTSVFSIASLALGLIGLILLFGAYALKKRQKPTLAEGLVVFLTAAAIPAGVKICVLAFDKTVIVNVSDDERLYVFVGGLAVIWVSIDAIIGALRERETSAEPSRVEEGGGERRVIDKDIKSIT